MEGLWLRDKCLIIAELRYMESRFPPKLRELDSSSQVILAEKEARTKDERIPSNLFFAK